MRWVPPTSIQTFKTSPSTQESPAKESKTGVLLCCTKLTCQHVLAKSNAILCRGNTFHSGAGTRWLEVQPTKLCRMSRVHTLLYHYLQSNSTTTSCTSLLQFSNSILHPSIPSVLSTPIIILPNEDCFFPELFLPVYNFSLELPPPVPNKLNLCKSLIISTV